MKESEIDIEKKLINDCLKNNKSAQFKLFETHAKSMLQVCFRYMNDLDKSNDMVQEGFIKVFKNLESYRNEGNFKAWIKRIMINECLNELKKENRFSKVDIEEGYHVASTEANSLENLEVDKIMSLVNRLPETLKTVINLHSIEGYSYHEIAKTLNSPEATIRTHIYRARKILSQQLKVSNA